MLADPLATFGACLAPDSTAGIKAQQANPEGIGQLSGKGASLARLADYEQRRNEVAMPIYELNSQFASQEPPSAEMQLLFQALRTNQVEMDRFVAALEGTLSPAEFFAPENVARIIGAAKLQA